MAYYPLKVKDDQGNTHIVGDPRTSDKADASALTAHSDATTNVHGIADTSSLATTTYVDTAVASFEAVPDQAGNAGKFLKTDGSSTSWAPAGGLDLQFSDTAPVRASDIWFEPDTGRMYVQYNETWVEIGNQRTGPPGEVGAPGAPGIQGIIQAQWVVSENVTTSYMGNQFTDLPMTSLVVSTISGASYNTTTYAFTLPAGNYYCQGHWKGRGANNTHHHSRLRTTSGVTLAVGTATYSDSTGGGQSTVPLANYLSLSQPTTFTYQYWTTGTQSYTQITGESSVNAQLTIWKVS